MTANKILTGTAALILIGAAGVLAQNGPQAERAAERVGAKTTEFAGLIRPSKHVELGLDVAGVLTNCPIGEGQQVQAGTVLAELDSEHEQALLRISELKANDDREIRAAELDEELKREEWERQKDLASRNVSSQWELRNSELAYQLSVVSTATAKFNQQLSQEEWKRTKILLEKRRLEAPFSGWLWKRLKDVGAAVEEFEPVAVLVQLDPLWIELNVPAERFGDVSEGDRGTVMSETKSREATVIGIDPLVDVGSSTFRVKVELSDPNREFVAGTMVRVRLGASRPTANSAKASPDIGLAEAEGLVGGAQ